MPSRKDLILTLASNRGYKIKALGCRYAKLIELTYKGEKFTCTNSVLGPIWTIRSRSDSHTITDCVNACNQQLHIIQVPKKTIIVKGIDITPLVQTFIYIHENAIT